MSSIRINNNWKFQKTPIYAATVPLTYYEKTGYATIILFIIL